MEPYCDGKRERRLRLTLSSRRRVHLTRAYYTVAAAELLVPLVYLSLLSCAVVVATATARTRKNRRCGMWQWWRWRPVAAAEAAVVL